ncbi:hypothetical protein [Thermomonas sp.]|uniref:hypothetical protein n=1 Tax=Thermomonas sp. TaxID=1971895 RepID=UPI0026056771|nr:hypothetical protein [Thermomonas sp.]
MLAAATLVLVLLFAVWFYLLYRFHVTLDAVDPALSREIGKPSLFWTAWNGHTHLVRLMRRRDLADGRHAPLAGQARWLRIWAIALLLAMAWVVWAYLQAPAV